MMPPNEDLAFASNADHALTGTLNTSLFHKNIAKMLSFFHHPSTVDPCNVATHVSTRAARLWVKLFWEVAIEYFCCFRDSGIGLPKYSIGHSIRLQAQKPLHSLTLGHTNARNKFSTLETGLAAPGTQFSGPKAFMLLPEEGEKIRNIPE